jgi:polyribonucleotide nucleotidyltransferase
MASVCGGSLALFDAGVPTARGRRRCGDGPDQGRVEVRDPHRHLGTEDHLGDMDFKVAGTSNGITSIQMDIKIEGLDLGIMREALDQAREGRLHILAEMDKALRRPKPDLSPYAPRDRDRSRSTPRRSAISSAQGQDDPRHSGRDGRRDQRRRFGHGHHRAVGGEAMERARQMVQAITQEPIVGETYEGS